MADIGSKADLLKAGYKGYTGWGETEAIADYRATGGQGKYDPGTPATGAAGAPTGAQTTQQMAQDVIAGQKQLQPALLEAQQPAIESLQAQKPITTAGYDVQREQLAGKEESMKTRYSNLLADIKGREERETTTATKTQAQELAQRGIAPGSTFYQQEIQGAQQPISQAYGGMTRDIGLAQSEEALGLAGMGKQLTVDEQQAQQDISAAVAAIKSATSNQAIQLAQQQLAQAQQAQQFAQQQSTQRYGIDVGAKQSEQQLALQQAQQTLAQQQYQQEWPYQQRLWEKEIARPDYKPDAPAGEAIDWNSLWDEFNA